MIVSRLLYGLSSAWLNAAQLRRLNGFQARCLRRILGIPAAFVSRVSNQEVLQRSGQLQLSHQLLRQQLLALGRIARAPDNDVCRQLVFRPKSLDFVSDMYVRRIGRPRQEWGKELFKKAKALVMKLQPELNVQDAINDAAIWRSLVYRL